MRRTIAKKPLMYLQHVLSIGTYSKRSLLLILYAALFITGRILPEIHADGVLNGTPSQESGATVYSAVVNEGDSYTSVYGVNGSSTDEKLYGDVIISGEVTNTVYGARALSGDYYIEASGNKVSIINGRIGTVYGGYAYGGSNNALVHRNNVTVDGGIVTGYVYGGNADGTTISITGNEVNIKNSQVQRTVYGACAFNTDSWLSALRNNVVIEDSTINGSVYGAYASGSATASNSNTVTIINSNIKGSVYGGYALSSNSDAKNNTVIIESGTFTNHIYGGIGRNTKGNTVVVKGGDLSLADVYGYSDGRRSHSENTLEVWAKNVKVKSAQNFENYYFIIPEDFEKATDYMLISTKPVNLSGSSLAIAVSSGGLTVGDTIKLIDNIEGTPNPDDSHDIKRLHCETALTVYDFNLEYTKNELTQKVELIATATSSKGGPLSSGPTLAGSATDQAKSMLSGQIAAVALLNEGTERAMDLVFSASENASSEQNDFAAFQILGGGKSHYFTDSHVTIDSIAQISGISKKISGQNSEGLFGFYFESGNGDYTTFDIFDNGTKSQIVYGEGNTHYYGGGLMLKLKSSEIEGLYLDAIGHLGNVNTQWSTDNLKNKSISFSSDSLYFGAVANTGYNMNLSNVLSLDLFGNFVWTHQGSSDTEAEEKQVHFNDVNSLKAGFGTKITYCGLKNIKSFLELALEREFNGEIQATVNNLIIDSHTLKGNTGLLKLGMNYNPDNANWQLDLEANGYIGIHKGLTGSVILNVNL